MQKLRLLLLAITAFSPAFVVAQEAWCGTDQHMETLMAENPEYRESRVQLETQLQEMAVTGAGRENTLHIIPVVFHVMWNDCEANISKAQIEDALRVVNEDFRRQNEDADLTREVFQPVAADAQIEFRLARIDPDGNPTEGIVRVQTAQTVNAGDNLKALSRWPSSEYLNIWIVESIGMSSGGGIILGYAQFPGSGSWGTYGVVMRHDQTGTIGTSNADGRTLTHEIGHCLDLYHTFQSGCGSNCSNSGDRVCDTPPSSEAFYNCSFNTNSCSNDAFGSQSAFSSNVPDMIENYMSYNSCQNLFTEGQKQRMKNVLEAVSVLKSLTSEENLEATGVKGMVEADYAVSSKITCEGNEVFFEDMSLYNAETAKWTFEDGTPSSSTAMEPVVTFSEPGLKQLKLTVKAGSDSAWMIDNTSVFVQDEVGHYLPYTFDPDGATVFPDDHWFHINYDEDVYAWELTSDAAYSGNKSFLFENQGNCGNRMDDLVMQSLDFAPFSSVTIEFKTAYAQQTSSDNDFLRVYTSNDCGDSWDLRYVTGGAALASASPTTSYFTPAGTSEWKTHTVSLNDLDLMEQGAMIKFQFTGRGGNNLYLDDIYMAGTYDGDLFLRSPENGATGLANNLLLDWSAVGGVEMYEVALDTTPDFNSTEYTSEEKSYINEIPVNEDTEFEAEDLLTSTTYYWKVRYKQGGQWTAWSDTWSFTTSEDGNPIGLEEVVNTAETKVYPNPAKGHLWVEFRPSVDSRYEVRMYDVTGRVAIAPQHISAQAGTTTLHQIDVAGLQRGIYMLVMQDGKGAVQTRSVVLQ